MDGRFESVERCTEGVRESGMCLTKGSGFNFNGLGINCFPSAACGLDASGMFGFDIFDFVFWFCPGGGS